MQEKSTIKDAPLGPFGGRGVLQRGGGGGAHTTKILSTKTFHRLLHRSAIALSPFIFEKISHNILSHAFVGGTEACIIMCVVPYGLEKDGLCTLFRQAYTHIIYL